MNSAQQKSSIKPNRFRWHRDFALMSVLIIITGFLLTLHPATQTFRIAGILLSVAAVIVGTLHAIKARKFR